MALKTLLASMALTVVVPDGIINIPMNRARPEPKMVRARPVTFWFAFKVVVSKLNSNPQRALPTKADSKLRILVIAGSAIMMAMRFR